MFKVVLLIFVLMSTDLLAQQDMDWIYDKQRKRDLEIKAEEKTQDISINTPFEKEMQQPALTAGETACDVEVMISYTQMNDKVRVDARISSEECNDAYGKYTVRVRTQNEAGETHTVKHNESWSLDQKSQIDVAHYYDMNGDTDLVWARVHANQKDFCTCRVSGAAKDQAGLGEEIKSK